MGVFISYSQKDKEIAYEVCHELEKKDIYCWIAPRNIDVGENWANQIVTAIEKEENYIVILSENSMRSNEVLKELTLASEMKKNIFALCVDGCEPTRGYKYHLSIAQRLDIKFGTAAQVVEKLEEKIIGKKKEKPLLKRKGNKVEIVTYKDLVERGFTSAQIAERLVANDKMLYPHIDQDNEGDVSQWEEYLSSYPQTFKYMVNEDNQIIGNWSIVILAKEDYQKAITGQMVEAELQVKDTAYFMFGGVYYGYLLNMSVNREYMNPGNIRLLFDSFLDQLEEFAEEDIYFNSYADEERADVISIINLCVSENARGLGIGKKLMESFLRQHRGEKIELCVLEENKAALDLYKKMGFKEVSRYQGFSVDERDIVCIGMEKY